MKFSKSLSIFSWSLYDFANTIFSMNVISLYFALWVTVDKGARDIIYSIAFCISMVAVAIFQPAVGRLSDRYKRRKPFLIFFTSLCVVFTALLATAETLSLGLLFFVLANFGYQMGGLFYTTLLPKVGSVGILGRVSGFGVSLGYVGSIVGLLVVRPFVLHGGRQAAFLPTAILFGLFSLPCFLFVTEGITDVIEKPKFQLRETLITILQVLKGKKILYAGLKEFLVATFLFLLPINTIIVFMSVYVKKIMRFSDSEIITLFIISTGFAILGSFLCGYTCDRFGPKKILKNIVFGWIFTFLVTIFVGSGQLRWIIGPLVGINLGSTWVSARALGVSLFPQESLGEVFGYFGLTSILSAMIGPLIWGVCVFSFDFLGIIKYKIAIFILLVFMIAGFFYLRRVPEAKGYE